MDANDDTRIDAPGGARPRVLVADDSESHRRIMRTRLVARGLDAVAVAGGRDALDRLAAEPFDLLLVDGMMPGLDGPATAREVRRREDAVGLPPIAIVAVSASGRPEDRERLRAAGIDDLVVKPVVDEDLEAALARWLPSTTMPRTTVIPPVPGRPGDDAVDGVIDEAAFSRLASLGDQAFVERMVGLFLADAEGRVAQVERARAAGDDARVRAALEAVQSIAAVVGATDLGRHAGAALTDGSAAEDLAADLEAARGRLRDLLAERAPASPTSPASPSPASPASSS